MKLVYTHPSIVVVTQAQGLLENEGIESMIRNEYAAGAIGELAPIDAWPELWVAKDHLYEQAVRAIEASHAKVQEADWHCKRCGRSSPATFDWCWNCAGERTAT